MSRWQIFFHNLQQDLKLFSFILGVFCVFRIAFIVLMSHYINAATVLSSILLSLYYGLRISLKSAGVITLLSFLFCTFLSVFIQNNKIRRVRYSLACIYISLLTLLFHVRLPYYEQFHEVFNQFIFNTFKDDTEALLQTLVQQYQLPVRLLSVLLISLILCKLLKYLLATKTFPLPRFNHKISNIMFRTAILLLIASFMLFTRFGGSFTYARSIHWENAAMTNDAFLNEAILDDVQALYRAHIGYRRLRDGSGLKIDPESITEYGRQVAGSNVTANTLDEYLKKEAHGAQIAKPRHIFLIVGENYAEWPLLPKFEKLHLADGIKKIAESDNGLLVKSFLPNGGGTIQAVNGIITGLAEVNLYPNYQDSSGKEPYATSFASQMKKLGYKTTFWYAGFSSWQRIKDFSLSQGFDEFYSCNDLHNVLGNAWGTEDKYLFRSISEKIPQEQPTFNVIMTMSNHPPYTVDLQQEHFDETTVDSNIISDSFKKDDGWKQKLGHFWYADKVLAEFIASTYKKYPDSLFIIVGDHGERVNVDPNPSLFERYAVPFVLYGNGINKKLISPDAAGSHLSIAPTLIELIAPKGFTYYSICRSLTEENSSPGFSSNLWITNNFIGPINSDAVEPLPWATSDSALDKSNILTQVNAAQAVSWWRIKKGNHIK